MENIEVYKEGDITYTVVGEDPINVMAREWNERWLADAYQRYQYIGEREKINKKCPFIFLTINPNPHITIGEFISVITKMMSKPWIVEYLYVFEQRGEDEGECGKGFHYHGIIKKATNKSYAHTLRELASSANKVCDSSVANFFNLKSISEEEKERKIVYITGQKADEAKHKKQMMDIIFREKNKLKSFYNVGII